MEYLGNCPKCKHHTIVETVKLIAHVSGHNPQRGAKCLNCGKISRVTVIGEVDGYKTRHATATNPEFANHNKLTFKLW